MLVSRIMRRLNFVNDSCISDEKCKKITRRVCGIAGMNLSPIPAKKLFLLSLSASRTTEMEWA
jgi:hypothetical protein